MAHVKDTKPETASPVIGEGVAPTQASPEVSVTSSVSSSVTDPVLKGVPVIEAYLKTLPGKPGVYRMINVSGMVLYVGKAKSLKKRVASYTRPEKQSGRIFRMITETASMEFVTTHTEAEALLLEANMIKQFTPRYNILLRDDKSFPAILVTGDHPYPQILKHRGAKKRRGDYFGPFASVWAVNESLAVLQRAFLLRTCTDSVMANRTRPCLLHQIKRCSAPCVERITEGDYRESVEQARAFLSGDSQKIQQHFANLMQQASDDLEFEVAAQYRDRIRALTNVQAHQDISLRNVTEADVICGYQVGGSTCIQVFFFRGGANYGNRAYFPSHSGEDGLAQVIEAFIAQFYDKKTPPTQILVNQKLPNSDLLEEALAVRAERRVHILEPRRGDKRNVVDHAALNARQALERRMSESASQRKLLEGLASVLGMESRPERIEVYDNSHVSGTKAVGGMIVSGPEGFIKGAYRKFTIKGAAGGENAVDGGYEPGDDYAMMREVLTRRFSRALKEDPDRSKGQWPDLVLIDGGKGQLSVTLEVFEELGVDDVALAGIAKGPERNAGRETIYLPGQEPINLPLRDPVLYFIQRLRDEAHRYAIGAHRQKRSKALVRSIIDEIPGVGASRKKALLHHFGDARSVSAAGRVDLEAVDGVSKALATKIYDWFHSDGEG